MQTISSNQEVSPELIVFANDVYITEILMNVNKYTSFVDQKEYKRAIDKAKEIIYVQLKTLLDV